MKRKLIFNTLMATLLLSCGVEQFAVKRNQDTSSTGSTPSYSTESCSQYTLVKPQVDMLFLWDNSSSSIFVNDQIKNALNNVVNHVSGKFDYNVMLSPLIGSGNSGSYFFSAENRVAGNGITTISSSQAVSVLDNFPLGGGSYENGAERARDLISRNINNVFRPGAYTIIVLMSNDDDNSWRDLSSNYAQPVELSANYINGKTHDLLCIRGNYDTTKYSYRTSESTYNSTCSNAPRLNSPMMRFISITALGSTSQCSATAGLHTSNYVYKRISNQIYTTDYTNNIVSPTDQSLRNFKTNEGNDSYDICQGDFAHVFDGVNESITDTIVRHVYNYWPLASSSTSIDSDTVTAKDSTGREFSRIPDSVQITEDVDGTDDRDSSGNRISGFKVHNYNSTKNTRFLPSSGEPYYGKHIQLFGDAKVTWPTCMQVSARGPKDYFGYYKISSKPNVSTLRVYLNGTAVPQSSTNGWEYVEATNVNTRITSCSNKTSAYPPIVESGYFIKFNGNYCIQNNTSVNVDYEPAGT